MVTRLNLAAALALLATSIPAFQGRKVADIAPFPGFRLEREPAFPGRSGWTNARYKRAALKRRNVLRNRRAQRG